MLIYFYTINTRSLFGFACWFLHFLALDNLQGYQIYCCCIATSSATSGSFHQQLPVKIDLFVIGKVLIAIKQKSQWRPVGAVALTLELWGFGLTLSLQLRAQCLTGHHRDSKGRSNAQLQADLSCHTIIRRVSTDFTIGAVPVKWGYHGYWC